MKEIKAIIREDRVEEVLDALEKTGIINASVTKVAAVGRNIDPDTAKVSMQFGRKMNSMAQLALICGDRDDLRIVDIIRNAACTGSPGDGIISVANVNRVVKIRTGAESLEAIK